jgi:hypothetical protein
VQKLRTVELVLDTTPPDLQLIGPSQVEVSCGEGYEEPGYLATDLEEGDITDAVVVSGGPLGITTPPGIYTLTYTVTDSVGQAAPERTRTVVVLEDCPLYVEYIGETDGPNIMRKTIMTGEDYTFAVRVTGAIGVVSYQWLKSENTKAWTPIPDTEGDAFTLTNLQTSDAGMYKCVVSDAVAVAESPEVEFVVESGLPVSSFWALCLLALALAGVYVALRGRGVTA